MSKYNVGDKVSLAVENFRNIPKGTDTSAKDLTDLLANGVAVKLDQALSTLEAAVPSLADVKVETVNPEND